MGKILLFVIPLIFLLGCTSANVASIKNSITGKKEPSASKVLESTKSQIKIDTHKNSVKALLGDPMMIKRGANGEEMWGYDKVYLGAKKHANGSMSFLDMGGFEYLIGAGIGIIIANLGMSVVDIDQNKYADTYKKMFYLAGVGGGITLIDYLKDGGYKSYSLKSEETLTILISFREDRVSSINYHYSRF